MLLLLSSSQFDARGMLFVASACIWPLLQKWIQYKIEPRLWFFDSSIWLDVHRTLHRTPLNLHKSNPKLIGDGPFETSILRFLKLKKNVHRTGPKNRKRRLDDWLSLSGGMHHMTYNTRTRVLVDLLVTPKNALTFDELTG